MYKVYAFRYKATYGGGLGIVAASTKEAAQVFVEEYSHHNGEPFELGEELTCLHSDKEGVIRALFYIE